MLPKLMQCPACKHVWIYTGSNEMRIGCPVCSKTISGQKIGICTLTLEQYAELKGEAYLKEFQRNLENLSDDLAMLEKLYATKVDGPA
jgi:hypothetical protein